MVVPHAAPGLISRLGADFFETCWGKQWTHIADAFDEPSVHATVNVASLDALLMSGVVSAPDIQLIQRGRAHDLRTGIAPAATPDVDFLVRSLSQGIGFRIQHLERYSPSVARLCRAFEHEVRFPARANLYVSPSQSSGLAPHFDACDEFILQVAGEKHWHMFRDYTASTEWPDAETKFSSQMHRPIGEPKSVLLRAGDVLYIPRGVMHSAYTQDSVSMHLTFSVLGRTWADFIIQAVRAASQRNKPLRELVPFLAPDQVEAEALVEDGLQMLAGLASRTQVVETLETSYQYFRTVTAPAGFGSLASVLTKSPEP